MLASFPKSGSTWANFLLAHLLWQVGRELSLLDNRFIPGIGRQNKAEKRLPSGGRLIRTHERYRPEYAQAIYVVRDGRDVAVSMYWQLKRTIAMKADFSDYLAAYLEGWLTGAGPWSQHVTEWLDSPAYAAGKVLVIRYEDMKVDAASELRRMASFLGVTAADEAIADALEAGSFKSMKERERETKGLAHLETNERISVVRKGEVGDWRNYFSAEDQATFAATAGAAMARLGYDLDAVPVGQDVSS
jgi:hypothetical protein